MANAEMSLPHCAGKHVYDVGMMGNGALAGLVAITSGTSTIYPWGALIVGFVAGAWYCLGSQVSIWLKVSPCYILDVSEPLQGHAVGWPSECHS